MEILTFNKLKYILRKPTYLVEENPTIIFLHGAGTRGDDIQILKENIYFSDNSCVSDETFPFLVFAPQCYADTWFDIFEQLQEFVKMVVSNPLVDKKHVYLMGISMGGYATWQLAMSMPNYFAAIAPICGGGMRWNAKRLKSTPVWAFHGEDDPVVPADESIRMVEKVNECGGTAKLTLLADTGHNSWIYAYAHRELFEWLLLQENKEINQFDNQEYNNSETYG